MKMLRILLALAMLMSILAGCDSACEHQWEEANCARPKTCKLCGETDGEPTDKHKWEEATTEAPKTCSVCRKTEGDAIDTDERFTTAACKSLFGSWEIRYESEGAEIGILGMTVLMKTTMRFTNDGELFITQELQNPNAFQTQLAQHLAQMIYDQYAIKGMDRNQADLDYQSQYGKSVTDFSEFRSVQITENIKFTEERVYYVEDGLLFTGEDWGSPMNAQEFEVTNNGKLLLTVDDPENPEE